LSATDISWDKLYQTAEQVGQLLKRNQMKLAVAESCTGGLVAEAITAIAGSSEWFDRGFVTYTDKAKQQMLGIDSDIIATHGAVSEQTAKAMAEGVLRFSDATQSIAVTGIAGPSGGTATKPVGTVWIAWAQVHQPVVVKLFHFTGDRLQIRMQAALSALDFFSPLPLGEAGAKRR